MQELGTPYADTLPRPRVILIYGELHERDRFMAHLLADRVGPNGGVSLRPIAGFAEHDTYTLFVQHNHFTAAIDELLTLEAFSG